MNCQEIIEKLQSLSSEKYKANVIKMGIPEKCSIGISTSEVRKLAKEIGNSNELACYTSNFIILFGELLV
ncbi:MAG: hypothetical protein K2N34_13900 [Lachnospiraceae bacterium]|nr:hypothetical protein [Lachnospiraceae bacterium]